MLLEQKRNYSGPRARQKVLRLDTQSQIHKRKIYKLNLIKMRNFCSRTEPVKTVKRQATDWVTVFSKYAFDKGLIHRTYKGLSKNQQ